MPKKKFVTARITETVRKNVYRTSIGKTYEAETAQVPEDVKVGEKITKSIVLYTMPIDEFIAHATKVTV